MFSINHKRPLVTFAVFAGLLAVAGPASASDSDHNGGGDRIHARPSAAIFIVPDNGPDLFVIKGNDGQENLSIVPRGRSCKWEISEYDA